MKVQLVVVQGKPEGMTIPLVAPKFKIGRGEGCQLRPNNDLVSREHSMFEVNGETVTIVDLGSRNGTEVNGKKLAANMPFTLKNGDLVKVGPLTFAVSIEGATVSKASALPSPARKTSSLDDVSHDEIDAWLVSDASKEPPDRPSGVYGGDTITIDTFKDKSKEKPVSRPAIPVAAAPVVPAPAAKAPTAKAPAAKIPEPEPEPEPEAEAEEETVDQLDQYVEDDGIEDLSQKAEEVEVAEEYMDESNPFYVKKQPKVAPTAAVKTPQKDSSDMAGDILRKMMDRRKASKS